jgi:uncharacterized protein (AIM24 family)
MPKLISDAMKVVETKTIGGTTIEIIEYTELRGAGVPSEIYYREKLGIRLKTVCVTLQNSSFTSEPGALHYFQGKIDMRSEGGGGVGGFLNRAIQSMATGETMYKTEYKGTGLIYLEPTYNHYLMLEIDNDEIVTDKSAFVAAAGNFSYHIKKPDSVLAGVLGGEGIFQPMVRGSGVVILQTPVPHAELQTVVLENDQLVVDGNFAVARTGQISMSIQKSQKSLLGSMRGGEGLVTVFKGSGVIWLAPTARLYQPSILSPIA